jgi:hypothetical protein
MQKDGNILDMETHEDEVFIILESDNPSSDGNRLARLVLCKRDLGNNLFALVAIGPEGGDCWSEFFAVYQLDKFNESILETKESLVGGSAMTDSPYYETYNGILKAVDVYCDFDDGWAPSLKEEFLCEVANQDGLVVYQNYWNWDDGIHLAASSNWQIKFRFR